LSTPFQNRLVGTIIVTAAIVIFLPGILDGEKKSYQSDFDNIPETPTFTGKVSANNFPESLKPKTEKEQFSEEIAQDDKLSADIVSVQSQPVEKIQTVD
jgi:DedD protein